MCVKKVLFVANCIPFTRGGGSMATTAYLDSTLDLFGRQNVDVMIGDETQIPELYKDIHFIKIPKRPKLVSSLGFISGKLGRFVEPAYLLLSRSDNLYSHCIFNCGRESGWLAYKLKNSETIIITIHHNLEVEYCMDNKTIDTLHGIWPYAVQLGESRAYKCSDLNLFLTNQDKLAFAVKYGKCNGKCYTIGTYDFKEEDYISCTNAKKTFDLVISGTLSSYQTECGIIDYMENYHLITEQLIPSVNLLITGRSPSHRIFDLASQYPHECTIVASPADINLEVKKSRIYLCPTNIGGGLKLRAMDGLKNGLPVLVHQNSARGYDYYYDKPYFSVYHDKESFKRGLNTILNYIAQTPQSTEIINQDFYRYFSYKEGTSRFNSAIKTLNSAK